MWRDHRRGEVGRCVPAPGRDHWFAFSKAGQAQAKWDRRRSARAVWRWRSVAFRTARLRARRLLTMTTNLLPRVIAVYNRFLCSMM